MSTPNEKSTKRKVDNTTTASENPKKRRVQPTKVRPGQQNAAKAAAQAKIPQNHKEQKDLKLERQRLKNPENFNLSQSLKKLWERLRVKDMEKAERQVAVEDALKLVRGQVIDVIFKHDNSRVIQSLLKHGNPEQRFLILSELKGNFIKLSQSKYGHHITLKALKYTNSRHRHEIIQEFTSVSSSELMKLIRHPVASIVMDVIYCLYANAAEKTLFLEPFLGNEYAMSKRALTMKRTEEQQKERLNQKESKQGKKAKQPPQSKTIDLTKVIQEFPDKKERILQQVQQNLVEILKKEGNFGKTELMHRLVLDYFLQLNLEECQKNLNDPVASPFHTLLTHVSEFVHTKAGAQLAILILSQAGAKERKLILKGLKGYVTKIMRDDCGWMVLARVFECVDDTVLIKQSITQELLNGTTEVNPNAPTSTSASKTTDSTSNGSAPLAELLTYPSTRLFFTYLLTNGSTKTFSPDHLSLLRPGQSSAFMSQTSKKPQLTRLKEGLAPLRPVLLKLLTEKRETWLDLLTMDYASGNALLGCLLYEKNEIVQEVFAWTNPEMEAMCQSMVACFSEPINMDTPVALEALKEEEEDGDSDDENSVEEEKEEEEEEEKEGEEEEESDEESETESNQENEPDKQQFDESLPINPQFQQEKQTEDASAAGIVYPHPILHEPACRILRRLYHSQLLLREPVHTLLQSHAKEWIEYIEQHADSSTKDLTTSIWFLLSHCMPHCKSLYHLTESLLLDREHREKKQENEWNKMDLKHGVKNWQNTFDPTENAGRAAARNQCDRQKNGGGGKA